MDRYPNVLPIENLGRLDEMTEEEIDSLDVDPSAIEEIQNGIEKNLFVYQGFSKFLIDNYDAFITKLQNGVLSTITGTVGNSDFQSGTFYIDNVSIQSPSIPNEDMSGSVNFYPDQARLMMRTYSAKVSGDVVFADLTGQQESVRIDLCYIPLMLGSSYCHLHGKSGKELLQYGECGNDPLGYFIIKGVEKVILMQVRNKGNNQLMYIDTRKDKKDRLQNTMTCTSLTSSSLVTVFLTRKKKKYHVNIGDLSTKSINVFCLYALFGGEDLNTSEKIVEFILRFAKQKYHKRMRLELLSTISSFKIIGDIYKYIQGKLNKASGKARPTDMEYIGKHLYNNLFPQMDDAIEVEQIHGRKLSLLSIMIVRLLMFRIGKRKLDNRDSWVNRRIDTAGKSFEHLFLREYAKAVKKIEKNLSKSAIINATTIAKQFASTSLTTRLENAFTPGRWSTKSEAYRTMTDILSRANVSTLYSHITRITIPSSGKGKTMKSRSVLMSQAGFICPAESPEGQSCGLNLNLACTAFVSPDFDKNIVYYHIIDQIKGTNSESFPNPILINGIFLGWCNGPNLMKQLVGMKRNGTITRFTSIVLEDDILHVNLDASRPMRPLLIVNPDTHRLVIEEKNMWKAPFDDLINSGCIEYLDPWEQGYARIAESMKEFNGCVRMLREMEQQMKESENFVEQMKVVRGKELEDAIRNASVVKSQLEKARYYADRTHCEINPNAIFGIVARMIPMAERSQAVRNVYQCNMGKQSLSVFSSFRGRRFDGVQRTIMYPTRSIFRTVIEDYLGTDTMPAGQNITIAMATHRGYDQEDSVVVNQASVDRGLFRMLIFFSYKNDVISRNEFKESFEKPPVKKQEDAKKYMYIGDDGLPSDYNHEFEEGDCVIGKVRKYNNGKIEDASTYVEIGEGGRLDKVLVSLIDNKKVAFVKLRQMRLPQKGDKIASKYAQKATIGIIESPENMPFRYDGTQPDILMNPLSMPSRQTIGQLIEILCSKGAAIVGDRVDASSFQQFDMSKFQKILFDHGFSPVGEEQMYDGITGKPFMATTFTGPCYYQMLRHLVMDKFQMRGKGTITMTTHQPGQGRSKHGGLRMGEMERDAMCGHGAPYLLQERLCESSDKYVAILCRNCGHFADTNIGKVAISCRNCGETSMFGKVKIPYIFKLLQQYLNGMGIDFVFRTKKIDDDIYLEEEKTGIETRVDVEGMEESILQVSSE